MTERPDNARLHDWLDDTVGQTPDPAEGTRQVMSQVEETSQVGRWLPFPVLHRKSKAKTPTATDTAEYQPIPIPASNGHTPTVLGRTHSMLSPVKAITAGAIVFAIGGVMLIAQPFNQQSSVPGAETEAVAATWVTGTIVTASGCSGPDSEVGEDVTHRWNYVCNPQRWTASDPRLAGEVASIWNDDEYRVADGGSKVVNTSALFIGNDGGGWTCSSPNLLNSGGLFPSGLTGATYTCVGSDGYAGLSAILVLDGAKGYSEEFTGLIFSGDLPPLPEPPAAE